MTDEKKDAINKCVTVTYQDENIGDKIIRYDITYHKDGSTTLNLPKGIGEFEQVWDYLPEIILEKIKTLEEEGYYDPDGYYPT